MFTLKKLVTVNPTAHPKNQTGGLPTLKPHGNDGGTPTAFPPGYTGETPTAFPPGYTGITPTAFPPGYTGIIPTAQPPLCVSNWTSWVNRDNVADGKEVEFMNKTELDAFCIGGKISAIECMTTDGISSYSSGEVK